MKKGFKEIVAWQYDGRTAIGVLCDDYCNHYISVAVNYFMDSNIQEGDLWYMDDIHKDDDGEIRLANNDEISTLINALNKHGVQYKYDKEERTIRIYFAYPTIRMKVIRWLNDKFNI